MLRLSLPMVLDYSDAPSQTLCLGAFALFARQGIYGRWVVYVYDNREVGLLSALLGSYPADAVRRLPR